MFKSKEGFLGSWKPDILLGSIFTPSDMKGQDTCFANKSFKGMSISSFMLSSHLTENWKKHHWITEVAAVHIGSCFVCSMLHSLYYGRAPYTATCFLFQVINSFPFIMQKRSNKNQGMENYILNQNRPVELMTSWKCLNIFH